MRTHGVLAKWNDDRGFGFIAPASGGVEIFVHVSAFPRDGVRPRLNELVSFETEAGPNGKPRAIRIMRPGGRAASGRPSRRGRADSPARPATALGVVMRFLHHALFDGPFINGFYYVFDVVLLLVFSSIGFRMRRTSQMVNNYYWLYDRTSAFSYKKKN